MNGVNIGKRKFNTEKTLSKQFESSFQIDKNALSIEPPKMVCPSPIFKLNIDCFHELFDYLTVDEVIAVGGTCKWLQQVCGAFIERNFVAKRKMCQNADIYMGWMPREISTFSEYLQKVSICLNSKALDFIGSNCSKLLKDVRLAQLHLNHCNVQHIQHILNEIEVMGLDQCTFDGEFYECFLKFCPKIRSLSISTSYGLYRNNTIAATNEWMHRQYANLEHLELMDFTELKPKEFKKFFELNSNVRTFSIDAKCLLLHQDLIFASNLKLDKLAVEFQNPRAIHYELESFVIVKMLHNLLVEMEKREVYKELHLYINFLDHENCVQKLFSLNSLTMLGGYVNRIDNPLMRLKELDINNGSDFIDLDALPDKLPILERIHFSEATSNHILPFVRHSPRLKQMKIEELSDGAHLDGGILDILTLNTERMKMIRKHKLMIYLNERVFVTTKWNKQNMNYSFVEVRRGESYEWKGLNSRSAFVRSF